MHFLARTAIVATIAATASAALTPRPHLQTAVLAGGCFWGMEAVFEHVKGVTNVVSGFAGGSAADASYDKVSSEGTRHAEAVRITYNPSRVSYAQLLQIYFSVAHDPTQVNRQGPDVGPSYRSAIFPQNAQQRALASRMIAVLKGRGVRVATKLESGGFYPAEAYHQDFERKHPTYPYIVVNDLPKLAALKRKYPQWWKA
jgi:peptide-methionine (S)-S-oxide reductase